MLITRLREGFVKSYIRFVYNLFYDKMIKNFISSKSLKNRNFTIFMTFSAIKHI